MEVNKMAKAIDKLQLGSCLNRISDYFGAIDTRVPEPSSSDDSKYLKGDGTWSALPTAASYIAGVSKLYTEKGNNTDGGITQAAVTSALTPIESNIATLQTDVATLQESLTMTYKAKGSVAFSELPATLTSDMIGWVYNVYTDFTTDSRFVEGAGHEYFAGENVVVVEYTTGVYKYDVLSEFIDLSNYPRVVSFDASTGTLTLTTQSSQ
jgi:hypothetical protein